MNLEEVDRLFPKVFALVFALVVVLFAGMLGWEAYRGVRDAFFPSRCESYVPTQGTECWPGHHLVMRGLVPVCECSR